MLQGLTDFVVSNCDGFYHLSDFLCSEFAVFLGEPKASETQLSFSNVYDCDSTIDLNNDFLKNVNSDYVLNLKKSIGRVLGLVSKKTMSQMPHGIRPLAGLLAKSTEDALKSAYNCLRTWNSVISVERYGRGCKRVLTKTACVRENGPFRTAMMYVEYDNFKNPFDYCDPSSFIPAETFPLSLKYAQVVFSRGFQNTKMAEDTFGAVKRNTSGNRGQSSTLSMAKLYFLSLSQARKPHDDSRFKTNEIKIKEEINTQTEDQSQGGDVEDVFLPDDDPLDTTQTPALTSGETQTIDLSETPSGRADYSDKYNFGAYDFNVDDLFDDRFKSIDDVISYKGEFEFESISSRPGNPIRPTPEFAKSHMEAILASQYHEILDCSRDYVETTHLTPPDHLFEKLGQGARSPLTDKSSFQFWREPECSFKKQKMNSEKTDLFTLVSTKKAPWANLGVENLFVAATRLETWNHAIERLKRKGIKDPFLKDGPQSREIPPAKEVQNYGTLLRYEFESYAFLYGCGKVRPGHIISCEIYDPVSEPTELDENSNDSTYRPPCYVLRVYFRNQ